MEYIRKGSLNDYLEWLMDIVDIPNDYYLLSTKLLSKSFYSAIDRDINRARDGEALRDEYLLSIGDPDTIDPDLTIIFSEPCSVLEMLVALSRRIDLEIQPDPDGTYRPDKWFWLMIYNLGLDFYSDRDYDENQIDQILTVFLDRSYGKDGIGSLFPVQKSGQKLDISAENTEIWFQMQTYILDNI